MNQDSGAPPGTDHPMKRKRGRPRKDESQYQQETSSITPKHDAADDMIGRVVSGVIEGGFDAGYFLSVNVNDTDKELRGVVFIPDKVTPITAANDVAPQAKMYGREDIAVPSRYQQTQPQGQLDFSKQTQGGGLTTHKNQSASCVVKDTGTGSNTATDMDWSGPNEMRLRDLQIKDIGGASSGDKIPSVQIPEYANENQALLLMPQAGYGDFSGKHDAVQVHAPKDSVTDATRLVDFFPTPETTQQHARGSGSNPNLVLFQDETRPSGTEQLKSPTYAEPRGSNLMTERTDTPMENVPEELQLELGNKITSGANHPSQPGGGLGDNTRSNIPEAKPQPFASKSGFLVNLFEVEPNAAKREAAASESGFSLASQAANKVVDCDLEEAIPREQTQ